ncbi:DUF2975 domain-containing protein [Gillisia hiemivivida]|uniref:DUF2975 domain-containing protein n=1 Tax=Gillisia hiemivivida TaxID=291190 RepID=A0A5C6ZSA9_9FLAO|nr:DUF2975 domain-containing protein [Gillisia hiemivivida]
MKSINTPLQPLKFFLNFIFIIVIISVGLNITGILFVPFFPESKFLAELLGVPFFEWKFAIVALIISSIILHLGFIYSLYVFKKLVVSLFDSPLFSHFQILSLKLLGQLIILLIILKSIFNVFSNVVFEKSESTGIHLFSFDSKLMALCTGLFFIYLSYIFKKAKDLRDENELTV